MNAIDILAFEIEEITGSCPKEYRQWQPKDGCEKVCGEVGRSISCSLCWKEWAEDEAARNETD